LVQSLDIVGAVADVEFRNSYLLYNLLQVHHTFATAGSDGAFNFWDKDSKQRLKVQQFPWERNRLVQSGQLGQAYFFASPPSSVFSFF
jgi:hypothetical protein